MASILDTGGFQKDYYIRVQRNMIEAGITDKAQYADLYINEISTDHSMETLCQCCSDEEGKKQYIKWRFHVRSRKDPNFEMIIGSTCIRQYKDIDPDELKYSLLLFEQEKKKIDKKRREDARRARVAEYAEKYVHYITYLKKFYELKHYYPTRPHDLYTAYQILVEGKKIFREEHEAIMKQQMLKLPLNEIEEKLEERERQRLERERQVADRQRQLEEKAQKRRADTLKTQSDRLSQLLQRDPNQAFLQSLLAQVQNGQQLTYGQIRSVDDIERKMNSQSTFEQRVEEYLSAVDNPFVKKMHGLIKKKINLSPAQRQTVERALSQLDSFKSKYSQQFEQIDALEKARLTAAQRKKLATLRSELGKAAGFGKFYNEHAENRFISRLQKMYDECAISV